MVTLTPHHTAYRSWLSLRLLLFVFAMMHFVFVASSHADDIEKAAARESQEALEDTSDPAAKEAHEVMMESDDAAIQQTHDNHMEGEDEAAKESRETLMKPELANAHGLHIESRHWDFGVGGGYAFVQNSPVFSQSFDLSVFNSVLNLAEEFNGGDRPGVPTPTGITTVQGTVGDSYVVMGYLFRKLTSFISLGLEGGYDVNHTIGITNPGALELDIFQTSAQYTILHLTPELKLGPWIGPLHLYGIGGAGWYSIHQTVKVTIFDTLLQPLIANEDAGIPPVSVVDRRDEYLGANWGGGLEYAIGNSASIGADVRYHVIFAPNPSNGLRLVVPTLHFDYHFL